MTEADDVNRTVDVPADSLDAGLAPAARWPQPWPGQSWC
jgi:hypothetical protein